MKQFFFLLFFTTTLLVNAQLDTRRSDPHRPTPEKIQLLWDTSLKLKDRDLQAELTLLESYIDGLETVQVVVSKFNSSSYETKSFSCSKGCDALFDFLKASDYNGASNFSELLRKNNLKTDIALVFTDGITIFEPLDSELKIPVFTINSKKEAAHTYLSEFSEATKGSYVDLSKYSVEDALLFLTSFKEATNPPDAKYDANELYYGVVYSEDKTPIQGAVVQIKNSFQEVQTESNGRYKIAAQAGDVLEISALGMLKKDTVLTETKRTHIPLLSDGELLDEILLQQRKKEEEKRKTAFGEKSKGAVGYLTQYITKEQISLADINAFEVIKRQPGIEEYQGGLYFTKNISINRSPILIHMDGIPVHPSILKSLDARQIENITQLKTLASTVRYGTLGVGGVLLIETTIDKEEDLAIIEDRALVKGNEYTETVPTMEWVSASIAKSNAIKALEKSSSLEEAKALYYKQLKFENNNIAYYLDAASYFERWNPVFSNAVLSSIAAIAPQNAKALKILAYTYEEKGEFEKARYVYEQLVNLRPQDIQSYRDLALMYAQSKEYELAATLYRQMVYNTIPNVDFAPIQDIVFNEFRHLIKNHKSQINYKGLPNELLSLEFKLDLRMVLEWNHPATEFDVQIVSPDEKFFSYSHTAFNNKELLQSEIDEGFFMKEFVIDDGEKGSWLLNIKYQGQHSDNIPLLLKYTQYKNYGKSNETRVVKVVRLDTFQDKVTLDSFIN